MQKIMSFMTEVLTPKVNKITHNAYIASIQDAIMRVLPLILVGSLVTIVSLLDVIMPWIPDFSLINTFTFGMIGVLVSFLVPYFILEKKKYNNKKLVAGATGLSLYLMLSFSTINKSDEVTFEIGRFGAEGMFVALIVGLFVGLVMSLASKRSFFKEDSAMPDFIKVWFDSLIPITIIMLIGWFLVTVFEFEAFDILTKVFSPLANIVQSYPGYVLSVFLPVFFFSFGVSPWAVSPIVIPVYLNGLASNASKVSQGLEPTNIATNEVMYAFTSIGGFGATLPLVILMLFVARSSRLKAMGKATIVPSIFNINEPVVFGAPIAFNPFLMIPMWLNALIIPSLVYVVLKLGIVSIPSSSFMLWYIPFPISSYLATGDWKSIPFFFVILIISFIIWYPFLKAYDTSEVKKENEANND